MGLVSIRAYAKHRGVAHTSVLYAIRKGKLTNAVVGEGKDLRIDKDIADREWAIEQKTGPKDKAPPDEPIAKKKTKKKIEEGDPEDIDPIVNGDDEEKPVNENAQAIGGFYKARATKEDLNAQLLQMKLDEEKGRLVDAEEIEKLWITITSNIRTKMLAVPAKMKQRLPEFLNEHYLTLEQVLREALEELSQSKIEGD
jgi:hypothetical protein